MPVDEIFFSSVTGISGNIQTYVYWFTKNASLGAMAINGTPQLTAFANDYGCGHIYRKSLESFAQGGDILIAISNGGRSAIILNAVETE